MSFSNGFQFVLLNHHQCCVCAYRRPFVAVTVILRASLRILLRRLSSRLCWRLLAGVLAFAVAGEVDMVLWHWSGHVSS